MADFTLDCKGLNCPLPIVRINQKMRKLEHGQTLSVEADDPAFPADLRAWARRCGHTIQTLTTKTVAVAVLVKN